MEPGNLQRLCGTPGARSGQARPQSEDSCPSYDDFSPGSTVRGCGGEVAQVRHDACRWSLETSRGCAGPPGPDLAKRDLNPMDSCPSYDDFSPGSTVRGVGAGVRGGASETWCVSMEPGNLQRLCGTPGARSGQARPQSEDSCPSYDDFSPGSTVRGCGGEVAQVRHGACRWSLETCRGCAGPPGPDLAKRDLNPRIPARVMTISVRARQWGMRGRGRVLDGVRWRK
jgi:hypothetical protein